MHIFKVIGVVAGVLAIGAAALALANPGSGAKTSAEGGGDKTLRARKYKIDLKSFAAEAEKTIGALSTYGREWKFITAEIIDNTVVIKTEVPVVIFTDDLEITAVFDPESEETTVNINSSARFGSSDLGENRRHIQQILRVFDEKFGS